MAIYQVEADLWGNEIQFQIAVPDSFTDQEVYELLLDDLTMDLTRES